MEIMVIGGSQFKDIEKKFINQGIKVKLAVEDLDESFTTKIVDVDKFVIVDYDFNVLNNAAIIDDLLVGKNKFFTPKEIVVISNNKRETLAHLSISMKKMEDLGKEVIQHDIRICTEDYLNITNIYNLSLGITKASELEQNEYYNVYLEPRKEKILFVENGEEEGPLLESSRNFSLLNKYDMKKDSLQYDKPKTYLDDADEASPIAVPVLEDIPEKKERESLRRKVLLVGGERKSGTTIFIAELVNSLEDLEKKVFVIDLSENSSTYLLLQHKYQEAIDLEEIPVGQLSDFKKNFEELSNFLNIESNLKFLNLNLKTIDMDVILYVLRQILKIDTYDFIVIDYPIFNKALIPLQSQSDAVFLTSSYREEDLNSLAEILKEGNVSNKKLTVILNEVYTKIEELRYLEVESAAQILGEVLPEYFRITDILNFTNLTANKNFALQVLGGLADNVSDSE